MASSDIIKFALEQQFKGTRLPGWKRISKTKIDGNDVRTYCHGDDLYAKVIGNPVGMDVSGLIIIQIDDEMAEFSVQKAAKATGITDWIFDASRSDIEGVSMRVFFSPSTGHRVAVIAEDRDEYVTIMHTAEPMYFYLMLDDDHDHDEDGPAVVMITAPKSYWDKHKAIPDWQLIYILTALYDIDESEMILDEASENTTYIIGVTLDEARALFEKAGMVYHEPLARAGQGG